MGDTFIIDEPEAQKDEGTHCKFAGRWSLDLLTPSLKIFYCLTLTNKMLLLCFCNIAGVKLLQPPLRSKVNFSLLNRDFMV